MKNIFGIDVSGCFLDVRHRSGTRARRFANVRGSFEELVDWAGDAELFVMEATGAHHLALADFLSERGFRVAVVNPARAKHFARSLGIRNKTDQVDTLVLAQFAERNDVQEYRPMAAWQKKLRALMRARENLTQHVASLKTQLKAPGLDEFVASQFRAAIDFSQRQGKEINDQAKEVIATEEESQMRIALLRTIPGIGEVLSTVLIAEMGAPEHFGNAKKAAAFAGVCPSERQSGNRQWKSRMSKAGSPQIRRALYFPAITAVRLKGPFRDMFLHLVEAGKSRMAALGAVMHKLLRVAYGVLKSGKPYNAEMVASG